MCNLLLKLRWILYVFQKCYILILISYIHTYNISFCRNQTFGTEQVICSKGDRGELKPFLHLHEILLREIVLY